ncbi:NAD(P)-dependent alcohol dehydrogenase [Kibdelosporangium lantanae]
MKAIVQDTYGTLEFRDTDEPVPTDDEVLVQVRAAGVDPGVWHLMAGRPYAVRLVTGLRGPRKPVRGMDVAGVVEAVGRNVTRFRPGDEVYGGEGTFAEYAVANPDKLAHKPENLTHEQAAAVPVSAATALQALKGAGVRVLVIGAAGGVGSYAVQLARTLRSHVTGVCSTSKVDMRGLGADDVIDYTKEPLTGSYDLVLDTAGDRPLRVLRRLLTAEGTLVLVGGEGGGKLLGSTTRTMRAQLLNPFVRHRLRGLLAFVRRADLETLTPLLASGLVTPLIDRTFPLADAAAAVAYVHNGHSAGKVVLTV